MCISNASKCLFVAPSGDYISSSTALRGGEGFDNGSKECDTATKIKIKVTVNGGHCHCLCYCSITYLTRSSHHYDTCDAVKQENVYYR